MRAFYAQAAEPKELVVIDGADHLFDGKVTEVAEAIEDLLGGLVVDDAVIVSAVRTAAGKAPRGSLRGTRPDDLAAVVIAEALRRAPGLTAAEIDDVVLGCAMPEAEQGLNVARIASLRAGIPVSASAVTINRFCSSGLQAIAFASERVMCGFAQAIVAGGTESMSLVPMGGHTVAPNPTLMDEYPDVYLSTGLVAENHARESQHLPGGAGRVRAAQPPASHRRDRRGPVRRRNRPRPGRRCGRSSDRPTPGHSTVSVRRRRRPAPRHLARRARRAAPGFSRAWYRHRGQLLADERRGGRRHRHLRPSRTGTRPETACAIRGLRDRRRRAPERFGIGPVPAIQKALKLAGLTLAQMDLVELNEAFAAQVLACLRELPIDRDRLNVNGGAIALGHPLGCTGAKLTATLLYEMQRRAVALRHGRHVRRRGHGRRRYF